MMAAKRFDTPETLGTAYLHATRALNGAKDVVAIPGDNSTPEQQAAFFTSLGRPADAAGYDFTPAEGGTNDAAMEQWARDAFFSAGLSGKQAGELYKAWNTHMTAQAQGYATSSAEAVAQVRQTWGADADSLIASGKQAARALGLDAQSLDAIERTAGTAPMMNLLAQIGKRMGGETGKFVGGSGGGSPADPANMTPQQAQAAIAELQGNKEFMDAYRQAGNPLQKAHMQRMEKLFAAAYPR